MSSDGVPCYSLHNNPIVYSFATIKRFLKEDYFNSDEDNVDFAWKIIKAALDVVTTNLARNQFYYCDIRVE